MKKRLLLMVPMLHQGGFERVCIKTARLLQDVCDVSILIFDDADIAYDITGLHVINLNMGSEDNRIKKIWNVIRRAYKVHNIKREQQIDICYSFGLTANLVNALSRTQEQVWVGIRGFLDLESRIYPVFCKRADKIVCCARMIEQKVREQYPQKDVVTIYNSFDFKRMEVLSTEKEIESTLTTEQREFYQGHKVIISVGREDDVKGFWHLIRAFATLQEKLEDARLVIVGEGSYETDKAFATMLGIRDKVLFTGVTQNPFAYVKWAKVYALTSISEGFPNGLVEAMALGTPVVATNCPSGPAEILMDDVSYVADTRQLYMGDYGILLPEISPVKEIISRELEPEEAILEQQLYRLLTDEQLADDYATKGIKRAGEFSEECYVEALMHNMNVH